MKTPPPLFFSKQRDKHLPKARMGYTNADQLAYIKEASGEVFGSHDANDPDEFPVAVLPTRTQQQGRQLVRWANLSYAQKVGELAKALATYAYSTRVEDYHGEAKCILNLLGESPDPEN